ncbi:uncharacterized protein LOC108922092 isoform X2 [Scleropages formosus]|uniref:uncharacterized protein LOC108922092 isoform X2 n=1 Tax=Scleropages formosus TaxID=113540 RepID=UPI0010FA8D5F|nr:uncharacterized protein LOC108922092 isoform X2 [Scleropages formosus]
MLIGPLPPLSCPVVSSSCRCPASAPSRYRLIFDRKSLVSSEDSERDREKETEAVEKEMAYRPICLWSFFVLLLHPVTCDVYYMQEGKDITIACMMKQKEKVIKWMYNSKDIFVFQKSGPPRQGSAEMTSRSQPGPSSSLKIKNLQRLDTGKYECHSSGGKTEHQLYVVTVSTSPAGPLLHSSKATLNCGVEGRSPTKRIWKRPNGINVDTENGIASLSYVTLNDSGTWLCLIEDNGKEYKQELKINVLGLNGNISLSVEEGVSVTLPCILSSSLSYPAFNRFQLDRIKWQDHKGNILLSTKDKVPKNNEMLWGKIPKNVDLTREKLDTNFSVVLKNVKVDQSGNYTCSVVFSDSSSLEVKVNLEVNKQIAGNVVHPAPHENQSTTTPVLEQNLWLWIAVGVGCAILISLIIVAVLLHQRKKRIKRRMRKMKSLEQRMVARDYCVCNRAGDHPNGNRRERTSQEKGRRSEERRIAQS